MRNTTQLRANGFHIFPVGHKVCFTDIRSGYTSPSYDAETCYTKLMEYIGQASRSEVGTGLAGNSQKS